MYRKFKPQILELVRSEGMEAVYVQAHVSIDSKYYCKDCFTCACVDFLNSSLVRTKLYNMMDVKTANINIGHHWFDSATMRFFKTRLLGGLLKNRLFVSSEKHHAGKREYSIRYVKPNGAVDTLGTFCHYDTAYQAKSVAEYYVSGLKWGIC